MITAEHERARDGEAGFRDAVLIEFCDPESDLFGVLSMARRPAEGRAEVLAVLCAGGSVAARLFEPAVAPVPAGWDRAQAGGATVATVAPLERWSAAFSAGGGGFEVQLAATSAPLDLDEQPGSGLALATGLHRYEQLCSVSGTAIVEGQSQRIAGHGRRVRSWGIPDWSGLDVARSVFAGTDGAGVSVSAVRPAGSAGHDEELVVGHLIDAGAEPLACEQVSLSTVYDAEGRPREAGLELLAPGSELPRRAGGMAAAGVSFEAADTLTTIAFFRWKIDGADACGSYQLVRRL